MRAALLARMREPSTWLGLSMLLGVHLSPELAQAVATAIGALAMVLPEGRP